MSQSDLFAEAEDTRTHRLFFALWPDDALRAEIARTDASLEAGHASGGRPLRPQKYHLTLQFLGDFRPLQPSVVDAARHAAQAVRSPAFDLSLDHAGSFSGSDVWWLGAHDIAPALAQLWDTLGAELAKAGVRVKSAPSFSPHLTIRRNVRRRIAPVAIAPLHWAVREFVLVDSLVGLGTYRIVDRWALAPR
jgi:RNA 2',3'-cyclic 3'-phosphodiesterase